MKVGRRASARRYSAMASSNEPAEAKTSAMSAYMLASLPMTKLSSLAPGRVDVVSAPR